MKIKVIQIDPARKIDKAPRNKYVSKWLDLGDSQALSFDYYDEMRKVYYSIHSYCRNAKSTYKPKQWADKEEKEWLIWKERV